MSPNQRLTSFLEISVIILHGLSLILFIGHQYLVPGSIFQFIGRMHPLMLHFPIVLLLLGWIWFGFLKNSSLQKDVFQLFFLTSLALTGLTVLSGLFLSSESGYDRESYQLHQWTGLALFWLASIWYLIWLRGATKLAMISTPLLVILLLLTGHLGASLTHGEDFLFQPFQANKTQPNVSLEEALAYDHVVKTILEQKCIQCHKASKQKGSLRLDKEDLIMKGGDSGPALDQNDFSNSLILARILLPLDDEEHMPPKGKAQLDERELELLQQWILEKAEFHKKLIDYENDSPFFQLASSLFEEKTDFNFPAASASTITSLNNEYRKVSPLYPDSPGLIASFFGRSQFNPESLSDLNKIANQMVRLNLNLMPLSDQDLKTISNFSELRELNLNFTGINGDGLSHLAQLPHLEKLSLSGNPLKPEVIDDLKQFPKLKSLFLWEVGWSEAEFETARKTLKGVDIESGFEGKDVIMPLNPPIIQSSKDIFQEKTEVKIKHPISSVKIHYTLDGSLPDSIQSPLYEKPIIIERSTEVRARAFAQGWLGSEDSKKILYQAGIRPDRVELVFPPSESYKGKGVETLFDQEKGDLEFTSGKWLGYQSKPLEVIMEFEDARTLENISISTLTAEASYIFPPVRIEIWGILDGNSDWKLIHQENPEQPNEIRNRQMNLISIDLNHQSIKALKAKLDPIHKLPKWHQGSGEKGWVFVDEIMVN